MGHGNGVIDWLKVFSFGVTTLDPKPLCVEFLTTLGFSPIRLFILAIYDFALQLLCLASCMMGTL